MVSYVKQNYLKFKYWLLFHIGKKEIKKKNNLSYMNKILCEFNYILFVIL